MKKFFLTAAALMSLATMQGQTILSEDFETGNTGTALQPVAVGAGWTTVNSYSGTTAKYNWHNYYSNPGDKGGATISGACCAAVDGAMFTSDPDGMGPREEVLLTPELDLSDTYQLKFSFKVGPTNHNENAKYDLQVRVVTGDNLAGAETVFSIQNEKMLRESGVAVFPIDNWSVYTARVDLSDFKGEKVKLAFVYKMYNETANIAYLDDVTVSKFEPATGPVASLSAERYAFSPMYIGEKMYSDVMTLTNTGKDGLRVTGVDCPAGFSINGKFDGVDLLSYKSVDFQIVYNAQLASATSGDVVFHTTGGDVKVAVSATKELVPEGYTLETFESYNPPAGWNNNGWTWTSQAFEGDRSMAGSGDIGVSTLRSPLLDLSDGGKVIFYYFNQFDDSEYLPTYDIELQVSYDAGDNWTTKWKSTGDADHLNQLLKAEVDLGYGNDMCYVRWMYPQVETDDDGAFPHSTFTLDRVLLPNVYGAGGVPASARIVSPANGAESVYPRDIKLEWSPAQFAEGYKVYVGTNTECNDLVNGEDVGSALSYVIPSCAYSTTYRWKVVPYNSVGNASSASTWRFTTQPDASVSQYPYVQDFEADALPDGWSDTPSANYSRTWSRNNLYPYVVDGKTYNVYSTTWLQSGDFNAVNTQEFMLPADKTMNITFAWGDEHPADLKVDPAGLVKKNNVEPNNGASALYFEVFADGKWNTLSTLSEKAGEDGKKYWINEKVDLSDYKGKTVLFRWRHNSYSGKDDGGSLAHIVLSESVGSKAAFNKTEWNAGKVNYNKAVNSGDNFVILNQGTEALKVKDVKFSTANFSSSVKAGDVIPVDGGLTFNLQFDAQTSNAVVEDKMVVDFESGNSMELPVVGEALPEGTYYYSFEPNPLDYVWDQDFSMIDVDKGANYSFSSYWIHYSADGQRGAFSVESDSKEDGLYGMMAPVSGMYALVGASPQNSGADNWIISKKMKATEGSAFEFYARNWESVNSVLPAPKHCVTVLVSTTGNTNTADFEVVMRQTEIPYLNDKEWKLYNVDLSAYAGKDIYVALRHTTTTASNLVFLDDFRFNNFDIDAAGIDSVVAPVDGNAEVEVYNMSGVLVAKGQGMGVCNALAKGFYVVKVSDANGTRAFSIAR